MSTKRKFKVYSYFLKDNIIRDRVTLDYILAISFKPYKMVSPSGDEILFPTRLLGRSYVFRYSYKNNFVV